MGLCLPQSSQHLGSPEAAILGQELKGNRLPGGFCRSLHPPFPEALAELPAPHGERPSTARCAEVAQLHCPDSLQQPSGQQLSTAIITPRPAPQ